MFLNYSNNVGCYVPNVEEVKGFVIFYVILYQVFYQLRVLIS